MHCTRCGIVARKIHRPYLLRLLLPVTQMYYCWPCHRRFLLFTGGPVRATR